MCNPKVKHGLSLGDYFFSLQYGKSNQIQSNPIQSNPIKSNEINKKKRRKKGIFPHICSLCNLYQNADFVDLDVLLASLLL